MANATNDATAKPPRPTIEALTNLSARENIEVLADRAMMLEAFICRILHVRGRPEIGPADILAIDAATARLMSIAADNSGRRIGVMPQVEGG